MPFVLLRELPTTASRPTIEPAEPLLDVPEYKLKLLTLAKECSSTALPATTSEAPGRAFGVACRWLSPWAFPLAFLVPALLLGLSPPPPLPPPSASSELRPCPPPAWLLSWPCYFPLFVKRGKNCHHKTNLDPHTAHRATGKR